MVSTTFYSRPCTSVALHVSPQSLASLFMSTMWSVALEIHSFFACLVWEWLSRLQNRRLDGNLSTCPQLVNLMVQGPSGWPPWRHIDARRHSWYRSLAPTPLPQWSWLSVVHLGQHGNLLSSANSKSVQKASPIGEPEELAEVFVVENCGHLGQHGNLTSLENSKFVQKASPVGEPKRSAEVFVVKNCGNWHGFCRRLTRGQ